MLKTLGTLLASAISPDNTPHGYNLTFAFPMLMFIIIAALLYLRFRSPHRVPGQATLASAHPDGAGPVLAGAVVAGAVVAGPEPEGTTGGSTLHEGTEPDESEDGE